MTNKLKNAVMILTVQKILQQLMLEIVNCFLFRFFPDGKYETVIIFLLKKTSFQLLANSRFLNLSHSPLSEINIQTSLLFVFSIHIFKNAFR